MASIVQHQHTSTKTAPIASPQMSIKPLRKPHGPRVCDLDRVEQIIEAVRKFGAATVKDLAAELRVSTETIRHHVAPLVLAGRVVLLVQTGWATSALYGPAELDERAEFDLYRRRTSSWPRGQAWRDPLVAALFGDAQPAAGAAA